MGELLEWRRFRDVGGGVIGSAGVDGAKARGFAVLDGCDGSGDSSSFVRARIGNATFIGRERGGGLLIVLESVIFVAMSDWRALHALRML